MISRGLAVSELSTYPLETLWDDGEFVLSRRVADPETSPLLVLAPASAQPASASVARLEHAYALRVDLDSAWAARPVALEYQEGRPTLLIEDPGGKVLAQIVGKPWDLTAFLRVAIGLAVSLGGLHTSGLIHKDVKPGNILVNLAGGVWLTGFGIASRVPRERQSPEPPEFIAGTLAYMAPEQTGRMNRSIDSRSDLYSLGITLYEMLTGEPPFKAADPMEWIHCHVARLPVPPSEQVNGIPTPVAAVVLKLLAKTAEDRYQSTVGLETDLRRCLAQWESDGRVDPFLLGAHDVSDRLLIPEKLYGREREIDTLLAAFDRVVADGKPELVLVSGYAGIGKSSLVNELHKALVPPRGLFAAGKFDRYKRNIPYATLAQAFQSLVRHILSKSDAVVDQWRHALLAALGPNGQLMVTLIPELALIIGEQPQLAALPPQDAHNRFQRVFRRFLGVFARPEHPLALFLDDLQWLDTATLDLLEHLSTHPEVRDLLLVGAYRDNEVGPTHPLLRTLQAIRKSATTVHEIVLAPLGLDDVCRLVSESLRCSPGDAQPLSTLVRQKTGGNPFFTIQFLTALVEAELVDFDSDGLRWSWDLDQIRAREYTDNVVDLMLGELARLPVATQDTLTDFACLGNVVQTATLSGVRGVSVEDLHDVLWASVQAGFVLRHEGSYAFLHDRVQEAAYALIPVEARAEAHRRIGCRLVAMLSDTEIDAQIFEVVSQFNRGQVHLSEFAEREQVAALNLRAGRRAKASAAYVAACGCLAEGAALLGPQGWTSCYELQFTLALEHAECAFLNGQFDDADAMIATLLTHAAARVDMAAVYRLKIDLHVVKSETPRAVDSGLECLRRFGIDIPAHPSWEEVQEEYEKIWRNLEGRSIESLVDLPEITDPEMQAVMRVLAALIAPAFFIDGNLMSLLICQSANLSLIHGIANASTQGYAWLGWFLGPVFHRYDEGYRFGKLACELVSQRNFLPDVARVTYIMGLTASWTQPLTIAIDLLRDAFRMGVETGDLYYACYSCAHLVSRLLMRGDNLDQAADECRRYLDFVRKTGFRDGVDLLLSAQQVIASLRGLTRDLSTFSDAEFDEAGFEARLTGNRMSTLIFRYWTQKIMARFLSGDYEAALAAADKARPLLWTATIQIQNLDYHYYTALALAACVQTARADLQGEWRARLDTHCEELRVWATETGSPTFLDKHALMSAEVARLDGRELEAEYFYEQAVQLAHENSFVQNEGIANECTARFYAARGFKTIAHAYLRNARYCYLRWGAGGKVKQLDRLHPHLSEEPVLPRFTSTMGTSVEHLDLATVVKVSQAVSGEIDIEKLIEKLMRIALEHAGAERGLLIFPRGAEMRIEAEATTGRDTVEVRLRQAAVTSSELPESMLHFVIRTQESVVLDDASAPNQFSTDEYIRQKQSRSVLCLPLVKQSKLIGVLYLENNLAPHVFTPARIAVLKLLASQAAISLENARLYTNTQQMEAYLEAAQRLSHTGSFGWRPASGEIVWSEETYRIVGCDRAMKPTIELVFQRIHPEDIAVVQRTLDRGIQNGTDLDFEHRFLFPDRSDKYVHVVAHAVRDKSGALEYVGSVMDITEQHHAKAALEKALAEIKQSQDSLRLLIDTIPSMVWTALPDGSVDFISQSWMEYYGISLEDLRLDYLAAVVHPEDIAETADKWCASLANGKPFEHELRSRRADGEYRWFLSRAVPLRDQLGNIVKWYGTVTDIEDRKQAEEMRAAQARQASVRADVSAALSKPAHSGEILRGCAESIVRHLDAAFARIWTLNKENNMLELQASAGMYTHLNGPHSRIQVGKLKIGLIAQEKKPHLTNDVLNDPRVSDKVWARDEGMVSFAGYPLIVQDRVVGVMALFARQRLSADILDTLASVADSIAQGIERKRTGEQIQQSEAYLAEAQRLSQTGSFGWNVASGELFWSDQTYRIVGVDQETKPTLEMVFRRIHPEDIARVQQTLDRASHDGKDFDFELRFLMPNGSIKYVHVVAHAVKDESGNLEYVGALMDITGHKQGEDALRKAQGELAHVTRVMTMGELAASIAHEVNQPLTAVIANANASLRWLAAATPNLDEAREAVSRIVRDGNRAGDVIARIRALIQKTDTEKTQLNVNQTVHEVVMLIQNEAGRKGVTLRMDLAADVPPVLGDRVQLQQVILNLVMNGVEAMASMADRPRELLICSRQHESDQVLIAVQDSGIGIDSQNLERIFDAFYSTKSQGMGMGLAISRSIVENHGGRLWAVPNDGPGATFQFTLQVGSEKEGPSIV